MPDGQVILMGENPLSVLWEGLVDQEHALIAGKLLKKGGGEGDTGKKPEIGRTNQHKRSIQDIEPASRA